MFKSLLLLFIYTLIISTKKVQTKEHSQIMDKSFGNLENIEIKNSKTNQSLNFEHFKKLTIIFTTLILILISLIFLIFPATNLLIMRLVYIYLFSFFLALIFFSNYPEILYFLITIVKVFLLLGLLVFLLVFLFQSFF